MTNMLRAEMVKVDQMSKVSRKRETLKNSKKKKKKKKYLR